MIIYNISTFNQHLFVFLLVLFQFFAFIYLVSLQWLQETQESAWGATRNLTCMACPTIKKNALVQLQDVNKTLNLRQTDRYRKLLFPVSLNLNHLHNNMIFNHGLSACIAEI